MKGRDIIIGGSINISMDSRDTGYNHVYNQEGDKYYKAYAKGQSQLADGKGRDYFT